MIEVDTPKTILIKKIIRNLKGIVGALEEFLEKVI